MGMNIVMFIIFLLTDLGMVGIFAFIYSGKEEYSEGMILGVHIPKDEINHEEVQSLGKQYKINLKKFNIWNLILATLICLLCFWSFAYFMLLWTVWLIVYLVWGNAIIYISHRKMYDLKMKHNWVLEANTHIVHIDTVVTQMAEKLPISHLWNIPVVASFGGLFLLPSIRNYFGTDPIQWIFPVTLAAVTFLFWGLHLWFVHRKNVVYSEDSSVNMGMNRMEKRTWSGIMLSANYLNLASFAYLAIKILINKWLYAMDYGVYIILQMVPVIVIFAGVIYMQRKRKEVLSMDTKPLLVDDDEYWKNGWYSNPNDTHTWVQDRMCSTNYSMNMAKPAAKVITVAMVAFITIIMVVVISIFVTLENAKVSFLKEDNQITIDAAMYDTDFKINEIQSVKIIDKIPDDDYTRTNGGDTDKYLIGHFEGKETGKCMLYLYRGYTPILEIKLADKTIFVNSKNPDEVEEWYQELIE